MFCRSNFCFAAAFSFCRGFFSLPWVFSFCRGFFVLPCLFYFPITFKFCRDFFVLPWLFYFAVNFSFCSSYFVLPWFLLCHGFLFCRGFLVLLWHLWATVSFTIERNLKSAYKAKTIDQLFWKFAEEMPEGHVKGALKVLTNNMQHRIIPLNVETILKLKMKHPLKVFQMFVEW